MKNKIIVLLTGLTYAAILLNGCTTSDEKVEAAKENVGEARTELIEAKQEAINESAKTASKEEWKAFKADAEAKIEANEIRITELKIEMKKPGKSFDEMYQDRIKTLEVRNVALKNKINDYEKSNSDWESFKREFNHDMDEFGQALKDLTVNNKN